jgi:hypothetical protein
MCPCFQAQDAKVSMSVGMVPELFGRTIYNLEIRYGKQKHVLGLGRC